MTSSATGTSCLFSWLVSVSLTSLSRLACLTCLASLASYATCVSAAQITHTGWWTESISDGGAHYGTAQSDTGMVQSLCGRVFRPLANPWACKVEAQHQPADPAHGCRACKAAKRLVTN